MNETAVQTQKRARLTPQARKLLAVVEDVSGRWCLYKAPKDAWWATGAAIAKQAGLKTAQAAAMLATLEKLGMVATKCRNGRRVYTLTHEGRVAGGVA